jgi:hypothetical protein
MPCRGVCLHRVCSADSTRFEVNPYALNFLYLIALSRGTATSRVGFFGLPCRLDGNAISGGQVLFEYVQDPLPQPIGAGRQVFRLVGVSDCGFRDWFGPKTSTSTASVSDPHSTPTFTELGRLDRICANCARFLLRSPCQAQALSSSVSDAPSTERE